MFKWTSTLNLNLPNFTIIFQSIMINEQFTLILQVYKALVR